MYKLIKAITIFFLFNSIATTKSFAQWTEVYYDTTYTINGIFCLNADTCFITLSNTSPMAGKVLKSVNGGATWDTIHSDTTQFFWSIFFIKDTVGFVTGFHSLLQTHNGGNTWVSYPEPCAGLDAFESHAFNQDTAVFVGGCGGDTNNIYLTTDGGMTLNPLPLSPSCGYSNVCCLTNLFFLNDSVGFSGSAQECIYKTTDRGFTWNIIYSNCDYDTSIVINAISFYNDTMGWFGGEWGDGPTTNLEYTTDGGYTWNNYPTMPFFYVNDLNFFADGNGYLAVGNKIYKTTDYGVTFNEQYLLSYSNPDLFCLFNKFFFLNSQVGYAIATHSVLKTTNGGGGPLGLNNLSFQNNFIKTYPNPSIGIFHLSINAKDQASKDVLIYDVFGKQVYQNLKTTQSDFDIDLSSNAQGVYLVKVVNEGKISVSRVVVI